MKHPHLPVFLFAPSALARLDHFVDAQTLFAFDLDGTLAPIVSDPTLIEIPETIQNALAELNSLAPVAVITGRSRSDALNYLGITPRYLIGNHGAEGLPGWEGREALFIRMAQAWRQQLDDRLPREEQTGILVENKGPTLSIHYRHAVNIQLACKLIAQAVERLHPPPRRVAGKFVENLLPTDAPDKGMALCELMHREKLAKAFFAGDDETDEDIFRLDSRNIFSVRVGKKDTSRARFYIRDQYEMARLLREVNRLVRHRTNTIKG